MALNRRHGFWLRALEAVLKKLPRVPRSILIGYPIFSDHIANRNKLLARTGQLFDWIKNGELKVKLGKRYSLSEAAQAHTDMESRRSVGKLLLIP
jgi:NADPH:quinone reductase